MWIQWPSAEPSGAVVRKLTGLYSDAPQASEYDLAATTHHVWLGSSPGPTSTVTTSDAGRSARSLPCSHSSTCWSGAAHVSSPVMTGLGGAVTELATAG